MSQEVHAMTPIPLRADPSLIAEADRRSFMRAITAQALASSAKGQQHRRAETILKTNWGEDSRAARVLKAAVSPTPSTSGFPAIPSYEVLPLLSPAAASMRLLRKARQLSLEGIDHVTLAGIPFSGRPTPIFIGEGAPAPVVMASTSDVKLGPARKIIVQAALTSELELASGDTAQEIISDALALSCEQSMDAALFSTAADDGTTPGGLLYNVAPLSGTAGGSGAAGIGEDVGQIADQISTNGFNPDDMTLITSPKLATMIKTLVGPKFNFEVMSSRAIPSKNIIGVVSDALMYGYDGSVQIDVSRETLMHYEGTNPLQIATGGVMASPTISAFQTDQIAIKVRARACWVIQPGALAWVQSVTW
jgi:hypothetical protein